jgi:hypothetical protein
VKGGFKNLRRKTEEKVNKIKQKINTLAISSDLDIRLYFKCTKYSL